MVYNGETNEVVDYFGKYRYELPVGENVADYIIDVISGDVSPKVRSSSIHESSHKGSKLNIDLGAEWLKHGGYDTNYDTEYSTDFDGDEESSPLMRLPKVVDLPEVRLHPSFWAQLRVQFERRILTIKRTSGDHFTQFLSLLFGMNSKYFLTQAPNPN